MLDNETKRKIDSARSILVGKVPDPKAQVEQITTALIYKFMDDMDREAEELGGNAKFLVGELESYKWANLMDKSLGGSERLNLYMSALLAFAKASNIPDIFRTIFKDAFLPYRDPETLNLFLKEIDYFDYDHSENLGNAFEYLLSILGSQGDAGQFRTPRHIIDFIVEVLEPKKNETVLDPACGTAGFLISAYKHIMANSKLTPDEKKSLMQNFTGYDISPDMVRLSLVNMYLHSFPTPKIYEYDTLTSEDRWNDSFDVILANPPFMTPKGGIRPHNRFSVQANRSEVLFVDYIAEHLNLNGRAGIIVPEGIIFQSANAYRALRKMLVDNGFLWAVVSLPAGVFQPYSGVKTSILLLDRNIAKKSENILFIKISNDGYDLGAQRREINKNDLPEALEILRNYRLDVIASDNEAIQNIAQIVPKTKIAESGDYNLTGDRYKENTRAVQTAYPMVRLEEICIEIKNGKNVEQFDEIGKYRVTRIQTISQGIVDLEKTKWTNDEVGENDYMKKGDILLTHINSYEHLGKSALFINTNEKVVHGINLIKFRPNDSLVNPCYLGSVFKSEIFINNVKKYAQKAVNQASVKVSDLSNIEIPLPPLEIQNQIVTQIEEWQKIIDGAKQVINSYRPTINIDPFWEMVKLGEEEYFKIESGGTPDSNNANFWDGDINWATLVDLPQENFITEIFDTKRKITQLGLQNSSAKLLPKNSILVSSRATIGRIAINKVECATNQGFKNIIIKDFERVNIFFVACMLSELVEKMNNLASGGTFKEISKTSFSTLEIPLPALEIQNQIVAQIEKERQAVESCKSLVEIFEAKIKAKIDEVWGGAN